MPTSYTLCLAGQPISAPLPTWSAIADLAVEHGFATRVLGCIFTMFPGVSIQKGY